MKMTLSVLQPVAVGSMLGIFDIPLIPCSGAFRVTSVTGETMELRAEKLQGDCLKAEFESIELLPDETLLYRSKGKNWEAQGILRRAVSE